MARVVFPRLQRLGGLQSASNKPIDEENSFRGQVEQAFERLVIPTAGGGDTTAKYLLDHAAGDLTNGIVIPRGLGPDRVPGSPSSMDDEMTDATHGYDGLWTKWSAGSTATYGLDPFGGLVINMLDNDSAVRGIEQAFAGFGSPWAFQTKVCMSTPYDAGNSYAGISIRDSSTGYLEMLCMGRQGTNTKLADYQFNGASSYSGGGTTVLNQGTGMAPTDWYYIRVSGSGAGDYLYEISTNGVAFVKAFSGTLHPAAPDKIGLFTYRDDSTWGKAYFQHFRRLV